MKLFLPPRDLHRSGSSHSRLSSVCVKSLCQSTHGNWARVGMQIVSLWPRGCVALIRDCDTAARLLDLQGFLPWCHSASNRHEEHQTVQPMRGDGKAGLGGWHSAWLCHPPEGLAVYEVSQRSIVFWVLWLGMDLEAHTRVILNHGSILSDHNVLNILEILITLLFAVLFSCHIFSITILLTNVTRINVINDMLRDSKVLMVYFSPSQPIFLLWKWSTGPHLTYQCSLQTQPCPSGAAAGQGLCVAWMWGSPQSQVSRPLCLYAYASLTGHRIRAPGVILEHSGFLGQCFFSYLWWRPGFVFL